MGQQTASEDFSDIPSACAYTYCGLAASTPRHSARPRTPGGWLKDIPVNHSPGLVPVGQPTRDTGAHALVMAALAWLSRYVMRRPRAVRRRAGPAG
jgi:hypothetical protein